MRARCVVAGHAQVRADTSSGAPRSRCPTPVAPDALVVDSTLLGDRGRQSALNQQGTNTPRDANQSSGPGQDKDVAPPPDDRTSGGKASVYTTGAVSSADRTMKASPISLPASRALPNRLQLTRALRPFRQRWPSSHVQDLDEEATATATANLRGQFYPVFRPRFKPWFDVDLVLEDDDGIAAWQDTLREFSQVLRERVRFATSARGACGCQRPAVQKSRCSKRRPARWCARRRSRRQACGA